MTADLTSVITSLMLTVFKCINSGNKPEFAIARIIPCVNVFTYAFVDQLNIVQEWHIFVIKNRELGDSVAL